MRSLLVSIVLFWPFLVQAQSPWVAGKHKGYVQLGYTTIGPYGGLFLSGDEVYNLSREVNDRTLQLFGEYGLDDKTSLLAVVPFKMMETGMLVEDPTPDTGQGLIAAGTFSTLGNLQLGLRRNFLNENVVLSGQLTIELPTSSFDENTGLRGGLDATSIVPSVSIGKGLDRLYGYLSTAVAFRTNDYSHEFRLGGELGVKLVERVYVAAVLDLVRTFENGNAVMDHRQLQSGMYLNNQEFFAYGIKGIVGITEKIGINGAFYGADSGNFVARAPSVNFAVYYKW